MGQPYYGWCRHWMIALRLACKFITLKREENKARRKENKESFGLPCRKPQKKNMGRKQRKMYVRRPLIAEGRKKAISCVYLVAYLHNCHERIISKTVNFFFSLLFPYFNVKLNLQRLMWRLFYVEPPLFYFQNVRTFEKDDDGLSGHKFTFCSCPSISLFFLNNTLSVSRHSALVIMIGGDAVFVINRIRTAVFFFTYKTHINGRYCPRGSSQFKFPSNSRRKIWKNKNKCRQEPPLLLVDFFFWNFCNGSSATVSWKNKWKRSCGFLYFRSQQNRFHPVDTSSPIYIGEYQSSFFIKFLFSGKYFYLKCFYFLGGLM